LSFALAYEVVAERKAVKSLAVELKKLYLQLHYRYRYQVTLVRWFLLVDVDDDHWQSPHLTYSLVSQVAAFSLRILQLTNQPFF
jgi:hypothetical protein